jgi:hypothetical protein
MEKMKPMIEMILAGWDGGESKKTYSHRAFRMAMNSNGTSSNGI